MMGKEGIFYEKIFFYRIGGGVVLVHRNYHLWYLFEQTGRVPNNQIYVTGIEVSDRCLEQLLLVVEEIFVNIADYAYDEGG